MNYISLIEKYRKYLPINEKTPIVSLCEGNTPLIQAKNLAKEIGFKGQIYFKFEGLNPTGSFKDRGMTMAVSKAVESGSKAIICASTGNTSASASAYAARAGIKCVVLIPEGKIALGKLSQALMHGAEVLEIDGNFDKALNIVKELSTKYPITLVNSVNPFRIEGQKTASYEICESLDKAPEYQFMPVGNAGNITAYWKGYKELNNENPKKYGLPKMMGFQAAGAAPIVEGRPVLQPETVATAIRIGNPASWKTAEFARDESKGVIDKVTDEEILFAYRLVAKREGVFCEPASAAPIAGLIKYVKKGYFKDVQNLQVVCILTGHGLKDPGNAIVNTQKPKKVKSDINEVVKAIGF
ncbi:MAG: threonine synthase [Endomicrobium sp.]|jgi:threonine synthase|uniref:threonine synthase n=1 Tax=Candidatus Endomicrobiellum cubanum TaxID=3242325 RepID=UPI00281ED6AB|nr:threonine synthase [Endomicrobium sp.]